MIPQQLEYLFLLSVLGLLLFAFLGRPLRRAMRSSSYWWSLGLFLIASIALDAYAIQMEWWTFSKQRLIGLKLATVPIEEYILIMGFHALVIGLWESDDGLE